MLDAKAQLSIIGPLAVILIFLILFALYGNFKFPVAVVLTAVRTEPVGALLALKLTYTPFRASSVLGLLVLMGVAVETAVIDVSYINKLRLEGQDIFEATFDGSLVRLRPIMMTALVACLGLLPPWPHHQPCAVPASSSRRRRPASVILKRQGPTSEAVR